MIFTRPLVFTILLMGIIGVTEVVSHKRGRGRRIRPSVLPYQNQNLPIQQSQIPQNNYYTPSSGYSTTAQKQLPVRPVAPRPGIVVFGVGPHSLQIPSQYSNFPATSYQSGKSVPQSQYTPQNTAATKPAPRPNSATSVAAKPVAYVEPAKSSNPAQYAQPAKSPQYGNKIPASNQQNKRPSLPAVPKAPVVKVPENVPVYISPVKSTVYASAYVSDPSNYPTSNSYTKEETPSYQTATPSYTSKSSVSSSYQETKAYQTTETYLKTTTKSENKKNQSYYSTSSPTVKVSETYATKDKTSAKEESYAKKEESYSKKEKSYPKKEDSYPKKEESYPKKEESDSKKEESDSKKEESYSKKEDSYSKKEESYPKKEETYSKKEESYPKKEETYSKKEESDPKKEESYLKKEESDQKKEESYSKKEESYPKKEESDPKKEESYSKVEESYGEKEESIPKKEESSVDRDNSKSPVYPEPQSYKKVESPSVTENKKKEDSPSYSYSAAQSKPKSDESSKKNPYEVSNVEESKPKAPIYPIAQSYKKGESLPDNEEKKELDVPAYGSSIPHSVQEHKPVKESHGKNPYEESYVNESEPKGPVYSASLSSHKKVESLPSNEPKNKYDSPSLPYFAPKQKLSSEPSKKNQNKEFHADETKVKTPVYSASQSYQEVESLPYTADKKKQNVPDYVPTTKPYQPKSAPVSQVNSYSHSKPTESTVLLTKATKPLEYSTESTTTTQKYKYPTEDRTKSYYSTTSKYQESTTYSSWAASKTQNGYTSSSYEKIPITTTQGYSGSNQYTTKAYNTKATPEFVSVETPYASYSSTASPGQKSNDRVYIVSGQEEKTNVYQKPGPSSNYQSYSNTGRDQTSDDRSSYAAKPVLNEYKSTDKSSSSKDFTSPTIGTENKTNYKSRPVATPADYLSKYNSKPIEKTDSSKTFAAVAESLKTSDHDDSEKDGDYSAIPGEPGTDYPIFSELPNDQFNCSEQRLPGYYADVSARCQVFHICLGDRQWSFLCPNGTIFSQEHFVCVWWYEFDCSKATSLYDLNEKLFVISSNEQASEGEYENKQYVESAVSEISKKSDKDYRSSKTKEESVIVTY